MATKKKAAKKRPPKKEKKPVLTAAEQKDFQERTTALTDEIRDRRGLVERTKAGYKSAKEMLAGSEAELERVCYEYTHPESLPLFRDSANGKTEDKPTAAPVIGEDWKNTPIRDALKGMPKKFYELCESKQLDTIGKLTDWKNEKYDRWWKDLGKGVGKATFDKLDDAILDFCTAHQKAATEAVAEKIGTEKPAEPSESGDESAE